MCDLLLVFCCRIIVEPSNEGSMDKVVAMIRDKIQVNGHPLFPQLAKDVPPEATLSVRIQGQPGSIQDLLLHPARGICRLNGWGPEVRKGIRIVKWPAAAGSETGARFVSIACTKDVVDRIKAKHVRFHCGVGKATAHWQNQQLHPDMEVVFVQQ